MEKNENFQKKLRTFPEKMTKVSRKFAKVSWKHFPLYGHHMISHRTPSLAFCQNKLSPQINAIESNNTRAIWTAKPPVTSVVLACVSLIHVDVVKHWVDLTSAVGEVDAAVNDDDMTPASQRQRVATDRPRQTGRQALWHDDYVSVWLCVKRGSFYDHSNLVTL